MDKVVTQEKDEVHNVLTTNLSHLTNLHDNIGWQRAENTITEARRPR